MPPLLPLRREAPKRSFRHNSRRPTLGTVPEPTVRDQQPFSREGVAHWPLYLCLLRNWAKRLFQSGSVVSLAGPLSARQGANGPQERIGARAPARAPISLLLLARLSHDAGVLTQEILSAAIGDAT